MSSDKTNAFGVPVYQYQIRLPGVDFEGPLDLLLHLIERNELPITEIALAQIADEYMSYINGASEVNPAELAEFLVIAAKLLLIKSIALLPAPPSRAGDNADTPNAAEELMAQLREYKTVKEAAAHLRSQQEQSGRAFSSQRIGPNDTILQEVNSALQEIGGVGHGAALGGKKLNDLLGLVRRRLLAQQQQQLKLPMEATQQDLKRLVRSVKIEDKILLLETRLDLAESSENPGRRGMVEFTTLFDPANPPSSVEVIVTFMAVLELLRRRQVVVEQDDLFGEIYIERIEPKTLTERQAQFDETITDED